MPDIGVRITTYNWRMRQARRELGWTQKELADRCGLQQYTISYIERLGKVSETRAYAIADALDEDVNYLFPPELRNVTASTTIDFCWCPESLEALDDNVVALLPSPDEMVARKQIAYILRSILEQLPTLDARVISMRFGLEGEAMSLRQVGDKLGVTREYVRQIEIRALSRLRHPARTRQLRDFLIQTE